MPHTRDNVFDRLQVDHLIQGVTRISWELYRHFLDPGPHSFQLQFGETGNPEADDWEDVGGPFEDVSVLQDETRRTYGGKLFMPHYRVLLDTPQGSYASRPVNVFGRLDFQNWLIAREIVRREELRHSKQVSPRGFLLKRKRRGEVPDPEDVSAATTYWLGGDIINASNPDNLGTKFEGGYYLPVPFWVDFTVAQNNERVDDATTRGSTDDKFRMGRCLAFPYPARDDVWVSADSDERYYFQNTTHAASQRNVPIVLQCEMKIAPASDPIYSVPVPA